MCAFSSLMYVANVAWCFLFCLKQVCIPGTKIALPGCTWPHKYLDAMAKVLWEKGVDIEIVLSNPGSIPGGLSGTEACYGNG